MSTLISGPPPVIRRYTPEDLLQLEDAINYELVDGELVERQMGMESSQVAAKIIGRIDRFMDNHPLGLIFSSEASYQCYPDRNKIRRPDVSFIRAGRLPGDRAPAGHRPIRPDLAVEVVSPNDVAYEIQIKVREYLDVGVPLVWVAYPPERLVRVHRPPTHLRGRVTELSADDIITGEDVLPGFECPVAEFFPAPTTAA